jgi:hypothetical protein
MNHQQPGYLTKLKWSLPWLTRYPFWRAAETLRRFTEESESRHLVFTIANHFEPSWNEAGGFHDMETQVTRTEEWCKEARKTGESLRDADGRAFRHTYFFPAEQYHRPILEMLSGLEEDGFGEVEIHLHHGVEAPDTAANLRRALEEFRDILAEEHNCLSRMEGMDVPMYAFVHGNLALANSAGGRFCGVDSEMRILAETGCYGDFTLPSAPDQTQVARINAIYECGHSMDEAVPHRGGPSVRVGREPKLPVIFNGPLVFNWQRRVRGLPVPRLDDGVLASNYDYDLARLNRWRSANIGVRGRPEWTFIKLYCHGFFTGDQERTMGEPVRRFFEEVMDYGERTGEFKVHFTTAREYFNIAMAAVDGRKGEPGLYRDYRLQSIRGARRAPLAREAELEFAKS